MLKKFFEFFGLVSFSFYAVGVIGFSTASALSMAYCGEDTDECKYQNCVAVQALSNWPEPTGSSKECEKYLPSPIRDVLPIIVTGVAVSALVATVLTVRRHKKKAPRKTDNKTPAHTKTK